MASARYWRVRTLQVYGVSDSNFRTAISTLTFRDTVSGAQIATGGTPLSSSDLSGFPSSNAYDGDADTHWISNTDTTRFDLPVWLGYDFGAAVEIVEIVIQVRQQSQAPQLFTVDSSDDGVTWTPRALHATESPWTAAESRTFSVTDNFTSQRRLWRLEMYHPLAAGDNSYIGTGNIEYRDGPGGVKLNTGGFGFFANTELFNPAAGIAAAYDASTSTTIITLNGTDPKYFGYCFASGGPYSPLELAFQNRGDGGAAENAPGGTDSIRVQYSDIGDSWTELASFTPAAWTTGTQTQLFTLPAIEAGGGSSLTTLARTSTMSTFRR